MSGACLNVNLKFFFFLLSLFYIFIINLSAPRSQLFFAKFFQLLQLPPRLTRGCSSQLLGAGQEQALLLAFFSTKKRVDSPLPFFRQLDLITRLGSNYCPIFNFSFSPFLYYNYIIFCQKKSTIFFKFFPAPNCQLP